MSLASIGVDPPQSGYGMQSSSEAGAVPLLLPQAGEGWAAACSRTCAHHARLLRDLVLYGLGSAAALGVDWSVLVLLVRHGVAPLVAAAVGFSLGMAVTYAASVTLVYADRRSRSRVTEALVFAVIGIAGLGLNELCLWMLAVHLGLAAPIAKAPTAIIVFLFNFTLRRAMLFVGSPS